MSVALPAPVRALARELRAELDAHPQYRVPVLTELGLELGAVGVLSDTLASRGLPGGLRSGPDVYVVHLSPPVAMQQYRGGRPIVPGWSPQDKFYTGIDPASDIRSGHFGDRVRMYREASDRASAGLELPGDLPGAVRSWLGRGLRVLHGVTVLPGLLGLEEHVQHALELRVGFDAARGAVCSQVVPSKAVVGYREMRRNHAEGWCTCCGPCSLSPTGMVLHWAKNCQFDHPLFGLRGAGRVTALPQAEPVVNVSVAPPQGPAPAAPAPAQEHEALTDAAWQDGSALPQVRTALLRRAASRVKHAAQSRAKGEPVIPLASFAAVVGAAAAGDSSDDSGEDGSAGDSDDANERVRLRQRRVRKGALRWVRETFEQHKALGIQLGKATQEQLTSVGVTVQGGKKTPALPLSALVALYGR